ncbi:MAG: glutathione-regulated potassium-efflux system protein KefC [Methanoregula sp. PtaU1.Bin051]|nr:MAG: glutathione-regulated potassium-efflux system protein KefC [Methanoregula sp. PtaU1.Bin051]
MEGIVLALFVCLVLALVTKYLSIPPIPFYIIGGVLLGQSGLSLVTSSELSHFFSQMGLIFLLFFMGLELKLERVAANRSAVLTSGVIDLNINMLIGFIAAYMFGFTLVESLVIASAFYISSTAMAITSLIENRKLMLREAETVIWLMMFEDLVLIIFLAIISAGDQNPFIFLLKIAGVLAFLYAIAHYGKEFLISILDRSDELPILFTFGAVLTTASFSMYIGVPETMMVIALGAALATTDPDAFEQHARPFKDVFLVVFFVFFGITMNLSAGVDFFMIGAISLLAIASKLISGILTGIFIHGSPLSGIEIWGNTIARGEFSIALAALFGSPAAATIIAAMVVVTSIIGAFTSKYSVRMRRWIAAPSGHRGRHRRGH